MKIIFLDFDGVMHVISQGHDEFGGGFHEEFVDSLARIVDVTDAKIVISAGARTYGTDEMQRMWRCRNLPGEVIDVTPFEYMFIGDQDPEDYDKPNRGKEIQWWLDHNQRIENYVILDDDDDMLESQLSHFVKCHGNNDHPDCVDDGYGLTAKCADKAIAILMGGDK